MQSDQPDPLANSDSMPSEVRHSAGFGPPADAESNDFHSGTTDPEFEAVDSLLDFLPNDNPSLTAQTVANQVFRSENRRFQRKSIAMRCAAFASTLLIMFAGWIFGSRMMPVAVPPRGPTPGIEQFQGLFRLSLDSEFLEALVDTKAPGIWDKRASSDSRDVVKLAGYATMLSAKVAVVVEKTALASYSKLPPAEREKWKKLADDLSRLSPDDRSTIQNRIEGLRITLANLQDVDRQRAEALTGLDRWKFLTQMAEIQRRQSEQSRKPVFSVSEFNRPDYLMDLAQVTRAWNALTPAQKKNVERRAMASKVDPARKVDRLRILALSLEGDGLGPALTKPALARGGPLQRALAKAETFKQEREKRRSDYQKIVSGSIPAAAPPAELEKILESAPSWLVESVDPLPPDEARRFLSLLKFLVENQDVADEEAGSGR